jgi:hypothetical protein
MKTSPRVPKGTRLVQYSTRNMRLDLLDRVRTLAVLSEKKTVEIMLNEVIEAGLRTLEPQILGRWKGTPS